MFVLGATCISLNPLPALDKVVPSKVKPASPCIADALVAVMIRLLAPLVIGRQPSNVVAVKKEEPKLKVVEVKEE